MPSVPMKIPQHKNAVKNKKPIDLSRHYSEIDRKSIMYKEVQYARKHGYEFSDDGMSLYYGGE